MDNDLNSIINRVSLEKSLSFKPVLMDIINHIEVLDYRSYDDGVISVGPNKEAAQGVEESELDL